MNVLGLIEVVTASTARRREDEQRALAAAIETAKAERAAAERDRDAALRDKRAALAPSAANPDDESPAAVVPELIKVVDRLADLRGTVATIEPERADAIVGWLHRRTESLLALCGVVAIVDDGPLDFRRHEVVADRPASTEDRRDYIAETVRPGYQWRGRLLRPQQVVALVGGTGETSTDENGRENGTVGVGE